ncbi:hypothetical protein [Hydrogenophaga sp.]|uniref:hypothetical protein n=1 Tax=Hydrogenophaga sp. TaxID=1904254 RepID=UPI0027374B42|nr:hypothetical protein [Hydrogenophaga sp.]MDP3887121.1 hypothetical protein [Hydrogenophaga sp.]
MTVDPWIFWGLCAMAAIGTLQAIGHLLTPEEKSDWTKPKHSPPGEAPEGFRWVLIPNDKE